MQPAGTYTIETIDTTLDNLSFVAYRRVSTAIMVPAVGVASLQRQMIFIDPLELASALKQEAVLAPALGSPCWSDSTLESALRKTSGTHQLRHQNSAAHLARQYRCTVSASDLVATEYFPSLSLPVSGNHL